MGCTSSIHDQKVISDSERRKSELNGKGKIADTSTTEVQQLNGEIEEPQNPYMTALTPKETFHLKMSWKGIRRSLEVTGVSMFMK